jgi:multiple sugar transport system substrate-binding protein
MAINDIERGNSREGFSGGLWIISLLALLALLVLCALPQPTARKYPHRIPVRFWHMWTAEWEVTIDRIAERFNESQDKYEVIPLCVPGGSTADSKFLLAVAGGDPPDVMAQWDQVLPKWADSHMLMPLDKFMTPAEWQAFQRTAYPSVLKIGTYQHHLYGMSCGMNVFALYYRVDQLRAAGLDPHHLPQTLEELLAWGDKLNRFDKQGNLVRMGFMPQGFASYAPIFSGGFYDWHTNKLVIDTPQNLRALQFLVDSRKQLGFNNVLRFQSGLTTGVGNADWPFITGSYSITVDGAWRVEQLAKYAPEISYLTAPVPPPAGGQRNAGWVYGNYLIIPQGARHAEGAWEFIKFWAGLEHPERAAEFYTWGGWLPISPAVSNSPIYRAYVRQHPQFQTFIDLMASKTSQPTPPVPYQDYLVDRIGQAEDSAVRGTLTPAAALRKLDHEIAQEQARRKEFGYHD